MGRCPNWKSGIVPLVDLPFNLGLSASTAERKSRRKEFEWRDSFVKRQLS